MTNTSNGEAPASTSPLEALKLQAISGLSNLKASPEVEAMLAEFVQKLEAVKSKDVPVVNADDSMERLRAALKARGTHGIISLGRKFKSMDDNQNGQISFEELRKALLEMHLSESDLHKIFRALDSDCSGYLTYEELLVGLRGNLTGRRLDMVERAFKVLDKTGDGQVTIADLTGRYDASKHPDVVLGVKSKDQVMKEMLDVFEAHGGGVKGDGIVTLDEFKKYYSAVSASIDLDDYFELVIRNAWRISGGEGWCANTTCKRVLVLHEDGTQTVQEIKDDFDVKHDQYLQKLKDQGVQNIKSIALYGEVSEKPVGNIEIPASPRVPTASARGSQTPDAAYKGNKRAGMTSSITFG